MAMSGGHAHPGLPPVPLDLPRMRRAGEVPYGDPPHFWTGGPVSFVPLAAPRRVRLRDGTRQSVGYEVRWYLDRVEGVTRGTALRRLYDVLLRPDGWVQCGCHWRRVMRREQATILVRVIPADGTVCGAGSLGCFSWGYEADRLPVAEMGIETIDDDGPWNVVTGMELQAHPLNLEDHYDARHQPYLGSLGTWRSAAAVGFVPTQAEIAGARDWLAGTVDPERIHH